MKLPVQRSRGLSLWMVLALSLVTVVIGGGYPLSKQDFVVPLDDNTFEHETQASTGQTTGSWLIWFHKRKDDATILGTLPDEDFWAEHHTIVGAVDVSKSELTKSRFNVRKFPALIFIHKGKVYRYPKEPDYPFSWDSIARFVAEDYALVEAEDVPDPRTWFKEAVDFVILILTQGEHYFQKLGMAFGIMVVAAIVNQIIKATKKKKNPKNKGD